MKVISYQAPNGQTIDISRSQIRQLTRARKWPRNDSGEYCTVSHGFHAGTPTYTDDELMALPQNAEKMFPLEEIYEVTNGEMFGKFSRLSAGDLERWREEGRYPELFVLLDRGINRIKEIKESDTADAEWSDATGLSEDENTYSYWVAAATDDNTGVGDTGFLTAASAQEAADDYAAELRECDECKGQVVRTAPTEDSAATDYGESVV